MYRPELPYFITTDKPVYNPGDEGMYRSRTNINTVTKQHKTQHQTLTQFQTKNMPTNQYKHSSKPNKI